MPAEEYRPAAHTSHTPDPIDAEYLPAQQDKQFGAPDKEYMPCVQLKHSVASEEEENFPDEHTTQALLASSDAYFPAAQLVHEIPLPTTADALPDGHLMHAIKPADEYKPAEHNAQPIELTAAANLPFEHTEQLEARAAEY